MIFVTVGTHSEQFDRLFREIDRLVGEKKINQDVFGQIGNCTYAPKNFSSEKFLSDSGYGAKIGKASLVISHGGAGAIINSLKNNKRLIVVPRLKCFGEHTNDHQVDLARAMEAKGKVLAVYKINELEEAILKSSSFVPKKSGEKTRIVGAIESFLDGVGEK